MKILKYIAGIIVILLLFICGLFLWQKMNMEKVLTDYWFPPKGKTINNYEIIRCDYNIFRPTIAFVSDQVILDKYPELAIYSSVMENTFFGQINENYLGATTIKNTTFPQLVAMVKEDCSQFQRAKGDPSDETINWRYAPYEPKPEKEPEPELTEEEIERRYQLEKKGVMEEFGINLDDFQDIEEVEVE